MTCGVPTADAVGAAIPAPSERPRVDPATTAGPFGTAFRDVVGLAVVLPLASVLLRFLR